MHPAFYVALCHIRPDAAQTQAVMERFSSLLQRGGGFVRRVNNSGIRALPVAMHGKAVAEIHKFASVTSIEFAAGPVLAKSIAEQVRGFDDVIRVSLLRADETLLKSPPRPSDQPPPEAPRQDGFENNIRTTLSSSGEASGTRPWKTDRKFSAQSNSWNSRPRSDPSKSAYASAGSSTGQRSPETAYSTPSKGFYARGEKLEPKKKEQIC